MVWVDVLVPANAVAGTYSRSVVVRSGAAVFSTVLVTLEVLNVAMPSTATMKSQVFVHTNDIVGSWATYQQLAELGLANRLSVAPDGLDPTGGAAVLGPLLNGTDPKVPLAGGPDAVAAHALGQHRWLEQLLTQLGKPDAARFWCDEVITSECASWFSTALASYPG